MTVLEIKNIIITNLRNSKQIGDIYTFGSLAKGVYDEYSDIDMIVSVLEKQINLAQILDPYLSVLYYRAFSSSGYPSGRYWFRNVSPFQKLDISFHSRNRIEEIITHGDPITFKSPPFKCELKGIPDISTESIEINRHNEPKISDNERMISGHIYKLQCAIKERLRKRSAEYQQDDILTNFISGWIDFFRPTWDGGDLNGLARQTLLQIPRSELHSYLKIENARDSDTGNIRRHYEICGYGGEASPECTTIIGKIGNSIIAALRLARENEHLVLRAMQVLPILRGMGIGNRILQYTVPILRCQKVFCLPYTHLAGFYGRFGFKLVPEDSLPEFLNVRLKEYRGKGYEVCAMVIN